MRGQAERLNGRLEALNRQLDQRPSGTGLEAYGRALEVADREEAALEAAVDELQAAQRLLRMSGPEMWRIGSRFSSLRAREGPETA